MCAPCRTGRAVRGQRADALAYTSLGERRKDAGLRVEQSSTGAPGYFSIELCRRLSDSPDRGSELPSADWEGAAVNPSLKPRMPCPIERPISGRRFAPKTRSTTTTMIAM